MAKIGIISDTHDVLRPQVMEILRTCDATVHAGDFTQEEILDQLRLLGNVYVVKGNNDWMMRSPLQKVLRFEIEGLRFVMAHEKWDVPTDLADADVLEAGDAAFVGRTLEEKKKTAHYSAPEAYRYFRNAVYKIYPHA